MNEHPIHIKQQRVKARKNKQQNEISVQTENFCFSSYGYEFSENIKIYVIWIYRMMANGDVEVFQKK